jgi:thiamine biosynthesis lipoprotein
MTKTVKLARNAMATRFEIVLHGDQEAALRAAGEEALDEVEHWEARLSLYRPDSEIAHVNARASHEPVRITPEVFALLERARQLWEETGGMFDPTVGPLVRCWGFMGGMGRGTTPSAEEVEAARQRVGMEHVLLDRAAFAVRFARRGMLLDLGAIGKGYAIERAVELIREAGVVSGLIHGGTSTIYALGCPPEADTWTIALERPPAGFPVILGGVPPCVRLRDAALSVSAIWGRWFQAQQSFYGHVLHPKTGFPVTGAVMSAVVTPAATEGDALSTALLILGEPGIPSLESKHPGIPAMVVCHGSSGVVSVRTAGFDLLSNDLPESL